MAEPLPDIGFPRVCIVGPSLKMGGIERASSTVANAMAAQGVDVRYIALFRQERFFTLDRRVEFTEPPAGLNETRLHLGRTLRWLRKMARESDPDSVLAFNYFYGAIVRLALAGLRCPVYVSDRSSPAYRWPRKAAWFSRAVYSLLPPAGLVAQTGVAAAHQLNRFGARTRVHVIPNALRPVERHDRARQKTVLAVGRLSDPLKGFDRLVEAFALLPDLGWELVFAGDGGGEADLRRQAEERGIGRRVRFLGKVADIDRVYAEAGIFVIPSRSEGFPNALCEAMAAGLPCVSFDFVAGPRDIITDGEDGYIVPDGDLNGLADRIRYLIERPDERERLGRNACAIAARLDMHKISRQYLDFILPSSAGHLHG